MNNLSNTKKVSLYSASGYGGGTTINGAVDTNGFGTASLIVNITNNNGPLGTTVTLQGASANASFVSVSSAAGAVATLNIPTVSGVGIACFNVDLRNIGQRWLNVQTVLTGTSTSTTVNVAAVAFLGAPENGIYSASGNNAVALFEI